jgi:threonylcarbamoyladenosine tRNA methylthiotransferase MtaB
VINTCTVTRQSDQKSRNIINHAARKNSGRVLVVTGCMVNNYRDSLETGEKITYVVDNERKSRIVSLVDAHLKGEMADPASLSGDIFGFETVDKSLHTRTSIKIQDGCDNFCSYCIVPTVRGRAVSRPAGEILENVKRVLDNGFREIVLTGVNISRYTYEGTSFEKMIERILETEGDFRVRISSMEPDGIGPSFRQLFMHPRMTPYLHLCVQSGSDHILRRMKRMYSVKNFMEIVERFRDLMPDFNFSTDVIVGFPGETEEDFNQTVRLVRETGFSHVHTFRYSRRKGTLADRMENQVEEKVKTERSELIRKISESNRLAYMGSMLRKKQKILVEKVDGHGMARGYGEHYLPVRFPTEDPARNRFENVILERVEQGSASPYILASAS